MINAIELQCETFSKGDNSKNTFSIKRYLEALRIGDVTFSVALYRQL